MSNDQLINSINIYFDTLGCAKNTCDTNKMTKSLIDFGYNIVDDPDLCDLIILNTCSFIETATQESIDTFFQYKNSYSDKKIIVVGCLVSRYKKDLEKALPEADAYVSCAQEDNLLNVIQNLNIKPQNFNIDVCSSSSSSPFSYVKISEGCNRFCSYCCIPYIRGKYKSICYEEIKNDVNNAVENGAKEIVLVAQDCGVWGSDFDGDKSLTWLLDNLSKDFIDTYFRILYIQPDAINKKLLKLISERENIISYLDIPLQHCNEKILEAMNRKGDSKSFLELIQKIRKNIPGCVLRTTFIVGFPGESESEFEQLCAFAEKASFDYAGCFEYSQEEGTAAAKLECQINSKTKLYRSNKLREILDGISVNKIDSKIGETFPILIEGFEEGRFFGRAYFQAPEVDGVVYISEYENTENVHVGQFVNVKIVDSEYYDLVGVLV